MEALASELSIAKESEGKSMLKLKEEIEGRAGDSAASLLIQKEVEALREQEKTTSESNVIEKKSLSDRIDQLSIEIQQQKSKEIDLIAQHTAAILASETENAKIIAKITEECAELKVSLSESESRLMEAETTAWQTKAESAELLYALELEQGSVKKLKEELEVEQGSVKSLKEELDVIRSETSLLASEHAEAVDGIQSKLQEKLVDLRGSFTSDSEIARSEEAIATARVKENRIQELLKELNNVQEELAVVNEEKSAMLIEIEAMKAESVSQQVSESVSESQSVVKEIVVKEKEVDLLQIETEAESVSTPILSDTITLSNAVLSNTVSESMQISISVVEDEIANLRENERKLEESVS